jgi:hypothetical protein
MKHTLRNYTFHAVVFGLALSSPLAVAQKRTTFFPSSGTWRSCRTR